MKQFLQLLAQGHTPGFAAKVVKISRSAAYKWREEDAAFAEDWRDAVNQGFDRLEDEAWRRGVEGVLKPVRYRGKVIGHIRKYSDKLLVLLLKRRRPDLYK